MWLPPTEGGGGGGIGGGAAVGVADDTEAGALLGAERGSGSYGGVAGGAAYSTMRSFSRHRQAYAVGIKIFACRVPVLSYGW